MTTVELIPDGLRRCAAGALLALGIYMASGCEQKSDESQASDAQSGPAAQSTTHNAADEYRALFRAMDRQLVAQLKDSGGELTPGIRRSLPAAQTVIDRLVWATRLDQCDWGIDYSAGLDTELPHLKDVRELVRLLRAHAELTIGNGDLDSAAESVAGIVRMARHVGGKATLEALVAFAVLSIATDTVTAHSGAWNASQRRVLLDQFRQIERNDPFGGDSMLEWEIRRAARDGMQGPSEEGFRSAQQQAQGRLDAAIRALE